MVVLSLNDEDDDMQEVADMASIGVVEGLISGMLEPQVDEEKMKQKFCNIFHTMLEGCKMVNEVCVELWSVIDGTPLQILGEILSDVYVSATSKTMFKCKDDTDDDDDDDDDDDNGEKSEDNEEEAQDKEPVLIQKIKCEPSASTSKSTPKEKKTQSKTPPGKNWTPRPPQAKIRHQDSQAKIRHQAPPRQKVDTKTPQAKIRHQDPPGPKADTKTPPRPKSKGFKAKGVVKKVGAEGLLEPMRYQDAEGAHH